MTLVKKVAYNTLLQIFGRVVGLFIMLVTINYIANHLVVNGSALIGFGQYTIVFAYASMIGVLADLGIFTLLVRDITGKSREEVGELVGSALGFRLLLFLISILVALLLYPIMPYAPEVKTGIIFGVAIGFSLLFGQTIAAVLQANLAADKIVIAETVGRLILAAGTIFVLKLGMGLLAVVVAHLVGYTITFILSYFMARQFSPLPIRLDLAHWKATLPQFWPIALITLLSLIHFKIDSIMLSLLQSEADVGIYGIAYKLVEIIVIIPAILASNILPVITQLHNSGRHDEFRTIMRRAASIMMVSSILITLVVFILAPWLIVYISQREFLAAVWPFRVLVFVVPIIFLSDILIPSVISARYPKALIWPYVLAVFLNIGLNSMAIPMYSYKGAAVTTVITSFILLITVLWVAAKQLGLHLAWKSGGKFLLAGIFTTLIVYSFHTKIIPPLDSFATMNKLAQTFYLALSGFVFAVPYGAALLIILGGVQGIKKMFRV